MSTGLKWRVRKFDSISAWRSVLIDGDGREYASVRPWTDGFMLRVKADGGCFGSWEAPQRFASRQAAQAAARVACGF